MRIPIQIAIFLVIFLACQAVDQSNSVWVRTHYIYYPDSPYRDTMIDSRLFLKFEGDSLFSKYFDIDGQTYQEVYPVIDHLPGEMIIAQDADGLQDTFRYRADGKSMSIYRGVQTRTISHFRELPQYNLANHIDEVYERLTRTSFIIFDSLRIEFRPDHRVITPLFDGYFEENCFWTLQTFEEELILLLSGFNGFILHINEIGRTQINGTLYGVTDYEIALMEISNESIYDISDIKGQWIEVREDPRPLPPPPPRISDQRAYPLEELYIMDTTIMHSYIYRSDTLSWSPNREQDLILLLGRFQSVPNQSARVSREIHSDQRTKTWGSDAFRKWRILSLDGQYLLIERLLPPYMLRWGETESVSFKRVN
ncbi:MAG: hypothetical protein AAGF87_11115 [Bacteroidota bacterium]